MTWFLFSIALAAILTWCVRGSRIETRRIFSLFRLSERKWRLVGTDLGNSRRQFLVKHANLVGHPDVVFQNKRDRNQYIVGELKGRKFRGVVRYSEYYQITGYMGCLETRRRNIRVSGVLAYNDEAIPIPYDHSVFTALLEMEPLYRKHNSGGWQDRQVLTPLHKRKGARAIRLNKARLVNR